MASEICDLMPVEPGSPTPHRDKLEGLLNNRKLPRADEASVREAIRRHESWIQSMEDIEARGDDKVKALVDLLNEYKLFVELEVIWDSEDDFLYRQRGQLKLDNSIIEEFLPRLVDPAIIPALEETTYVKGPRRTFSSAYFTATLARQDVGDGMQVRAKDQDFTVGRTAYLQASFDSSFPPEDTVAGQVYLAFIAAECKTNLDKTMFQEATATARDLRTAIPGSQYYLLCEWLDMTPISTQPTDISEAIILRGRRMSANQRSGLSSSPARKEQRDWYENFLRSYPIRHDRVLRFVEHLRGLFSPEEPEEEAVLGRGYF